MGIAEVMAAMKKSLSDPIQPLCSSVPYPDPAAEALRRAEHERIDKLLKEQHELDIIEQLNYFKSFSPEAREAILREQEIATCLHNINDITAEITPELKALFNKYPSLDKASGCRLSYSAPIWGSPAINIALERLRRAHLDACAEEMIKR